MNTNNPYDERDICTGVANDSIHQLNNLDKSLGNRKRRRIYPLTYIQAVFDAKSGTRLDAILDMVNSIYLPWKGTARATRIQVPFKVRRKGLMISYRNIDNEIITEKCITDDCVKDDIFGLDSSWVLITDALPISGNVTIGSNGNWFVDGEDTGFKAQGPKGDNGVPLQPRLSEDKTKIEYSLDGEVWQELFPLDLVTPTIEFSEPVGLEPGSTPTVTNIGDNYNVNLQLGLPKAPSVSVGSTTTIGEGNQAKVTNSGTPYAPVLNFHIPKGDTGRGITIKGFYPDLSTLQEKVTAPAIGDVYCVGSAEPYEGYVWTNVYSSESQSSSPAWQTLGQINKDTTVIVNDLGDREDVTISQKKISDEINKTKSKVISISKGKYINKDLNFADYTISKISELLYIPSKDCVIKNVWNVDYTYGIIFVDYNYNYISGKIVSSSTYNWVVEEEEIPENAKYFIIQSQNDGIIIETDEQLCTGISIDITKQIINNISKINILKEDINSIVVKNNLFDKREIINGYYVGTGNGLLLTMNDNNSAVSGLIPVKPNTIYYLYRHQEMDPAINEIRFVEKDGITPIKPLNVNGEEFTNYSFTKYSGAVLSPSNAAYFQFTCKWKGVDCGYDETLFIEGEIYSKSIFYLNPDLIPSVLKVKNISNNLFIKTSDEIIKGKYIGPSGYVDGELYCISNIIKLEKGVEYKWTHAYSVGTNNSIAEVDILGNYIKSLTCTLSDNRETATYIPEKDLFIRINIGNSDEQINNMYFSKSEYFDLSYKQGGLVFDSAILLSDSQIDYINNIKLIGKTIVFDGDSIGAGTNGVISWGKRILDKYICNGKNYSVGGATITSGVTNSSGNRHWISTSIDTIIEEYPQLDYLILEGGTNDADLSSQFELGEFDESDFDGPFDRNTFYGALDYTFQKIVSTYPDAKIGFIIAQKMGSTNSNSSAFLKRKLFFDYIVKSCKKWGIPYINLWEGCKLNPSLKTYFDSDLSLTENENQGKYYLDGQHLSTKGYELVTPLIEKWMKNI